MFVVAFVFKMFSFQMESLKVMEKFDGGNFHLWKFKMRMMLSDALPSPGVNPLEGSPKWLVHIPGHPWVLRQATGTLDHKTHHGPDSASNSRKE